MLLEARFAKIKKNDTSSNLAGADRSCDDLIVGQSCRETLTTHLPPAQHVASFKRDESCGSYNQTVPRTSTTPKKRLRWSWPRTRSSPESWRECPTPTECQPTRKREHGCTLSPEQLESSHLKRGKDWYLTSSAERNISYPDGCSNILHWLQSGYWRR